MATQGEKALARIYIGGWAVAHSALIVAAGFFVAGTAVAALELTTTTLSWVTSGASLGTSAQGIVYSALTSEFALNAGIAAELYLTYQAVACMDENAVGILTSGWFITGQSLVQNGLQRAFSKIINQFRGIGQSQSGRQLYRGMARDHPQLRIYEDSGIIQPRGGNSTLEQHVLGDTRSDYTSWTLDLNVAKDFAGADGIVLSVNESQILNITYNTYEWSPFQLELEVTILGPVECAITIK